MLLMQRLKRLLRSSGPVLTVAIIAVNVIVFLIMTVSGNTDVYGVYRFGAIWYDDVTGGEWWRLLTACFLHFGFLHLAGNMFSLFAVGSVTEKNGRRIIWLIAYFAGGVGGGLVSMLAGHAQGSDAVSAGASGCICSLVGLYIAELVFDRGGFSFDKLVRPLIAVAILLFSGSGDPQTDLTAHAAGLIIGAITGFAAGLFVPHRRYGGI